MREGYLEIYYADCVTPVKLGDEIETKIFFRKTTGKVVYVPGVSAVNKEMEFNGLTYVGIKTVDQGMLGMTVMPDKNCLKKKIKFLQRDIDQEYAEVKPQEQLFEDDEGNAL